MKNTFLALGAIALTLGACSSDDDGPTIDYAQLTQKWYYVSEKVGGETIPYDDHEACGKDYLEFKEDGTVIDADVWDCDAGTPMTDTQTMSYERDGKNLSISAFGFTQTGKIKKLTSTSMELSAVYDYDDDGDEETVVSVFTSTP
jgi:hypothetical protein